VNGGEQLKEIANVCLVILKGDMSLVGVLFVDEEERKDVKPARRKKSSTELSEGKYNFPESCNKE